MASQEGSLAGDVQIQRVKFHYFELYVYGMAQTADTLEVARRAATWLMIYMWRRALFEVQYTSMSPEARAAAMATRREGFAGGMPEGAQISSKEAFELWLGGARAYAPELKTEPLFVRLDAAMQFTTVELHTEDVGAVFAELGAELGLEPMASRLNSGRRNGVVGTSKALDERGMTQMLAKKLMQHKARSGIATIEVCYDDSTDTSDMGALLAGRAMMERKANKGLLATRCPELAGLRVFSDIAKDDPVRMRVFDSSAERISLREEVEDLSEALASGELEEEVAEATRAELSQRERELRNLEGRLRGHVLKEKRQAVFDDGLAKLATVPLETLRERRRVSERVEALPQLMVTFGDAIDCSLLLPSRSRKRAIVTAEQGALLRAGASWEAVQIYDASRELVQADIRVLRHGYVRLRLQPSAFLIVKEVRVCESKTPHLLYVTVTTYIVYR